MPWYSVALPIPLLAIHSQGLHLLRIAVPTHLLAKAHMYYYQSSLAAKLRLSSAPRQGIIHARPGKTGAAPQLYRGTEEI